MLLPPPLSSKVSLVYLRLVRKRLLDLGVDADVLLQRVGLRWETIAREHAVVGRMALDNFMRESVEASQRPWIGFEAGCIAGASTHGQISFAMLSSCDLRQAMDVFVRFARLRTDYFLWRQSGAEGGTRITIDELYDLGSLRRHQIDFLMGLHISQIEMLTGSSADTVVIECPLPAPAWAGEYHRCFKGTINFDARNLSFFLPEAILDTPCVTADSKAFERALQACEELLAGLSKVSQSHSVRVLLSAAAPEYPDLTRTAQHFNMSPQVLMRRLKNEGVSYQSILDEVRKTKVLHYLKHSDLTVEQIARQVGVADATNFSRTVRRWFGKTPSALRSLK